MTGHAGDAARASSTTLGYVLNTGVLMILMTGLLIGGSAAVEESERRVLEDELTVIGQRLASDITRADRLAAVGQDTSVTVRAELPTVAVGDAYEITVDATPGDETLVLEGVDGDVRVTVPIRTSVPLSDATVAGGTVWIHYDAGGDLTVSGSAEGDG